MVEIKEKDYYEKETEGVDSELQLKKFCIDVQSSINDEITSDFVLAVLDEQDKTGITEMTHNAYHLKGLINKIAVKGRRWLWNGHEWFQEDLREKEKQYIKDIANDVFRHYMVRLIMTAVLNRNIAGNPMLEYTNSGRMMEIQEPTTDEEKLKGLLKRETEK